MVLPLLALGWLFGLAAVALWQAPPLLPAATVVATLPAIAARWGRSALLVGAIAAVLALGAAWRISVWQNAPPPGLGALVGQEVTLSGVIASGPDPSLTTRRYRVDVTTAGNGTSPTETSGAVLITVSQFTEFHPGDRVEVSGDLEEAPSFEDFDWRAWLARQDIVGLLFYPDVTLVAEASHWSPQRLSADTRDALNDALRRALPEPKASLAAGIAFGRDGTMPPDLYHDFQHAGIAHIVAVSGSNVTLLTALTFLAFTPLLGRRWAIIPAVSAVLLYVAVVGMEASVLRAGVMALVFLAGAWLGRQQSSLAALAAAVLAMTLLHPAIAVDVGFQLSVAATAGIIVASPWIAWGLGWLLCRGRVDGLVPSLAVQAAALTLAAGFATLPVRWVYFGQVSLVEPLTNIIVEPLFAIAFWLSLATAAAGLLWEPLGWVIGWLAWYPLAAIVRVAQLLGNAPGSVINLPRGDATWALLVIVLMGIASWPGYRYPAPPPPRSGPARRQVAPVALAGAGGAMLVAIALLSLAPLRGPGALIVTVLDVGQGDAILITTPHGERILVDGGPSGIVLARELGATLPHWDRSLEAVMLTHPDQDHIAGLPELLDRFDVGTVYESGTTKDTEAFRQYEQQAPQRVPLSVGDVLSFDGVRFDVLWPVPGHEGDEANDLGLVLRVTYGTTNLLLAADIEAAVQFDLMAAGIAPADVLKVPHHGSKTSNPEFLRTMARGAAIISVGEGNRYGHPAPETLAALDDVPILRTDHDGRVTIRSDGETIRITTER